MHHFIVCAGQGRLLFRSGGYTRWRNDRDGVAGPLIGPIPAPTDAGASTTKLYRSVRYVHLNPCRNQMFTDPLQWPFSTHRDACGLVDQPVVPVRSSPERFHHYVSADGSAGLAATPLQRISPPPTPAQVLAAVSSATRTSAAELARRGPLRELFVGVARELCPHAKAAEIADLVGLSSGRVRRIHLPTSPVVRIVRQIAGDSRFELIDDTDLRERPAWRNYRHKS